MSDNYENVLLCHSIITMVEVRLLFQFTVLGFAVTYRRKFSPRDRSVPHHGGGVNNQVGECLVGLCHQG